MPGFTIIGVILAGLGAILISANSIIFIFTPSKDDAKLYMMSKYATFAPEEKEYNEEMENVRKKLVKKKIVIVIGFFLLVIGFCLQIISSSF